MMFGPDTITSPTSSGPASVPSARTTRRSVKNTGLPAEPTLRSASAESSTVQPGAASVMP